MNSTNKRLHGQIKLRMYAEPFRFSLYSRTHLVIYTPFAATANLLFLEKHITGIAGVARLREIGDHDHYSGYAIYELAPVYDPQKLLADLADTANNYFNQ